MARSAVRLVGVYDGLSASIAGRVGAQALWASGLCIAASKALPDNEVVTYETLVRRLEDIRRATRLPILADANTGFGDHSVLRRLVELFEWHGIDGISLEDKAFPRRNSFDDSETQRLERPEVFAEKIRTAARCRTGTLVVVARTEGFIAGESHEQVVARAEMYCEAGAGAVIVHSKSRNAHEVLGFARAWRRPEPIIVIPTTYPQLSFKQAAAAGIGGIICANQLMRAATQAIEQCATHLVDAGDAIDGGGVPLAPLPDFLAMVGSFDSRPGDAL
jgi:phosphoenolpyruvate phosphomutase